MTRLPQSTPFPIPATRRALLASVLGLGALGERASLATAPNGTGSLNGMPANSVQPFRVRIASAALDDLKLRLAATRWPEKETGAGWSQGVPLGRLQEIVRYWGGSYDLRRIEKRLNAFPQYRSKLDGLNIHFLHVRSKHEGALPILLTHGWPGSVVEFLRVIKPLTDPTSYGGDARDAFHVVVPSLPGYGFSEKPTQAGWGLPRIARAWAILMARLGYADWVAQGGDWGAGVATWMAKQHVEGLSAVHLNLPILFPPPVQGDPSAEEKASIGQLVAFNKWGSGYAEIQATRPQTLGYGLSDSPVGQAAWIYEKFSEWSGTDHQPERELALDDMLDNITLYWLTETASSSARLYTESFAQDFTIQHLDLPVAVSIFAGETYRPLKIWGERAFSNLHYWNEVDRGGHFPAFEEPALFVAEVRAAFRGLR